MMLFMKADKGNKIVIIDKLKYEEDELNIVHGEGFEEVITNNPLTKMVQEVKQFSKDVGVFGLWRDKIIDSNPTNFGKSICFFQTSVWVLCKK